MLSENDEDRAIIEATVADELGNGHRVLSLGGDHSITYPIVRAYAGAFAGLSIVHFDAHPDLYTTFEGNRYSHACPFARILEAGHVRMLVQIGIRTMNEPQRETAERYGVQWFGPSDRSEAVASLPKGPVYVSLDLDALDPAFAPGVSHREPGGLSVREILEMVRQIPGEVCGADIVELNPDQDPSGITAAVGAKFAKELVGRLYADAKDSGKGRAKP